MVLASAMLLVELRHIFEGHHHMTVALDNLTAKIDALAPLVASVQVELSAALASASTQDPAIDALSAKVDALTATLAAMATAPVTGPADPILA